MARLIWMCICSPGAPTRSRVHMLSIGHPLLGDQIYAPKLKTRCVFRGSCCTHTASRVYTSDNRGTDALFARHCLPPLRKRFKNFDNNRPPSGGLFISSSMIPFHFVHVKSRLIKKGGAWFDSHEHPAQSRSYAAIGKIGLLQNASLDEAQNRFSR